MYRVNQDGGNRWRCVSKARSAISRSVYFNATTSQQKEEVPAAGHLLCVDTVDSLPGTCFPETSHSLPSLGLFCGFRGNPTWYLFSTLLQSAKMNHLDPGAYLNHVLDEATLLVDLPYDAQVWSALLPWKFKSEDLSWQDRAEFFTSID